MVGVDPGSSVAGFGVVELLDGRLRHLGSGCIAAEAGAGLPDRLRRVHEALAALLREVRPDALAVESLFYARNVRSALVLAQSRGVVLLAAAQVGVPVAEYSPMEVKRATVGYGRAAKEQVQAMVARLLALPEPPPVDAADALGVAICHAHQVGLGPLISAAAGSAETAAIPPFARRSGREPAGAEGPPPGSGRGGPGRSPGGAEPRLRRRGAEGPRRGLR